MEYNINRIDLIVIYYSLLCFVKSWNIITDENSKRLGTKLVNSVP